MSHARGLIKSSFIVVGAGPSGLFLGIQLRRLGHSVTVLEAQADIKRPVCGEYLSPEGASLLEASGLADTLQAFEPVWGMRLVSPQQRAVTAQFPGGRSGVSLNREVFQKRLVTHFENLGGKIAFDERVTRIEVLPVGFRVHTERGVFLADELVGADGRKSAVGRMLDIQEKSSDHIRIALHVYLRPRTPLARYGQMHVLDGGDYVGINPINDQEVNFSVVTDVARAPGRTEMKEFINSCIRRSADLRQQFDELKDEKIHSAYPISRSVSKVVAGSAVLIGDASGFIDPLTGEGITTALKSAALYAEQVRRFGGGVQAARAYGALRYSAFKQKERMNHGLQWVIRRPRVCEMIAEILSKSQRVREVFIGVIGNIYTPVGALSALIHYRSFEKRSFPCQKSSR